MTVHSLHIAWIARMGDESGVHEVPEPRRAKEMPSGPAIAPGMSRPPDIMPGMSAILPSVRMGRAEEESLRSVSDVVRVW